MARLGRGGNRRRVIREEMPLDRAQGRAMRPDGSPVPYNELARADQRPPVQREQRPRISGVEATAPQTVQAAGNDPRPVGLPAGQMPSPGTSSGLSGMGGSDIDPLANINTLRARMGIQTPITARTDTASNPDANAAGYQGVRPDPTTGQLSFFSAPPPSRPTWMDNELPPDAPNPISPLADPIRNPMLTSQLPSVRDRRDLMRENDEQVPMFVDTDTAAQLRLNLGSANAPLNYDDMEAIRERARFDPSYKAPAPQWVNTPSGADAVMVDPVGGDTLYRTPKTPEILRMQADQSIRRGILENLGHGLKTGYEFMAGVTPADDGSFSRTGFGLIRPETRRQFSDRMDIARLNLIGRAAAGVGAVVGDLSNFGTYAKVFWRSHPGDVLQSEIIPRVVSGQQKGINLPTSELKRYRVPLGLATGLAMHLGSGNVNLGGIFNTEEGPRVDGFKAVGGSYDEPTKTDNYALAVYNGLLTGTSTPLLKWEQFHEERPDVSYEQYKDYQNYLWGDSGFQAIGGLVKATNNSIDAPEDAAWYDPRQYEARIAGYKLTPMGVAGAGAIGTLGALMLRRHLGRRAAAVRAPEQQRLASLQRRAM